MNGNSSAARSLRAHAIAMLARREHSVAELRRKLLAIGLSRASRPPGSAQSGAAEAGLESDDEPLARDTEKQVDSTIAWLLENGYLSEARFVESRLNARTRRYGNHRIELELAQHGVQLSPDARAQLRASEEARAQAVWQKKFGAVAVPEVAAPAELVRRRSQQSRFLAGRGFSAGVIASVLKKVGADHQAASFNPDPDHELHQESQDQPGHEEAPFRRRVRE